MRYVIKSEAGVYYDESGNNAWTQDLQHAYQAHSLDEATSIMDRLNVSGTIHSVETTITQSVHVRFKPNRRSS